MIAKWKDEGKGRHNFTCHLKGIKARPLSTHAYTGYTTIRYTRPQKQQYTCISDNLRQVDMCTTCFDINEFYILSTFTNTVWFSEQRDFVPTNYVCIGDRVCFLWDILYFFMCQSNILVQFLYLYIHCSIKFFYFVCVTVS